LKLLREAMLLSADADRFHHAIAIGYWFALFHSGRCGRDAKEDREVKIKNKRRSYTTFILGTALSNFGTRTRNIGHGPLDFCRVKAISVFGSRAEKLGGPRPSQGVVSAHLKRGPLAANQKYSRPQSPCAHD